MKRGIAAVVLDVDGTLVDSNDRHARAWCEALESKGLSAPYDVEAAAQAGIRTIAFRCGGGWSDEELVGALEIHDGPWAWPEVPGRRADR